MTRNRVAAFLLGLLAAPAGAAVIYDNHGLVVDAVTGSRSDWNTGQRQASRRTTITYGGAELCGKEVGALLYPGGKDIAARAFFCASTAKALETDAVLAYFTSSSAGTALAHLQVANGKLRVTRLAVSDDPKRDRLAVTRFEDARLPGWTRISTSWNETVMIRHAPLKALNIGPGKLLDVADGVAYLAVPPGRDAVEVEPTHYVTDAYGYRQLVPAITKFVSTPLAFRAVRMSDGRELARLDFKDTCLGLPSIQFDRPDALSKTTATPDVAFDQVPAWRAATLQLTQASGRAALSLRPGTALPRKPGCTAG
ncbi:hypothetical protein JL37_28090 [Achromobacter sp. RTa]|uniref:hypothetical protein n=1 Tax=Achromobacter sp. RTa TaxID=1532557 RepID=UPI0005106D30|nr:hypothetical protein [Achromobacter sp. RTa]KGD86774.1 hypothetical protein JL37_28090 [Achromobacter sp. RTa]